MAAESRQKKAARLAAEAFNSRKDEFGGTEITPDDVTLLWITPAAEAKGDWEALLFQHNPAMAIFWRVEYSKIGKRSVVQSYIAMGRSVIDDPPSE